MDNAREFRKFPYGIQGKILQKFTYKDMAAFERCSIYTRMLCKRRPNQKYIFHAISLTVKSETFELLVDDSKSISTKIINHRDCGNITFEFMRVTIETELTEHLANTLLQHAGKETNVVSIHGKITCKSETFSLILKTLKPTELNLWLTRDQENFDFNTSIVKHVNIWEGESLTAYEVFRIKAKERLHVKGSSTSGQDVIDFAKKWRNGCAGIGSFHLSLQSMGKEFLVQIFSEIRENPDLYKWRDSPSSYYGQWSISHKANTRVLVIDAAVPTLLEIKHNRNLIYSGVSIWEEKI